MPLGGCSDVSGLSVAITIAEYRSGSERETPVRKVSGLHKVSDVTLKRGIVSSDDTFGMDESRPGIRLLCDN